MAMVILAVACNEAIGHYRELQDYKCLRNILYGFRTSYVLAGINMVSIVSQEFLRCNRRNNCGLLNFV